MKFLSIAYYEFLKNIRDIKMALILILFPMAMIWPVGSAVGSFINEDVSGKIASGYVNRDGSIAAKAFEDFLNSDEIMKRLEVNRFNSEAQGQEALSSGNINVLIIFPENADKGLQEGTKQVIRLYGDDKLPFVDSLLRLYTNSGNAMNALISAGGKPAPIKHGSILKRVSTDKNTPVPNPVSYYSVLTLLQQLFLGAMFGLAITSKIPGSDIRIRTHALPVSGLSLTGGRIAGSTVYILLASGFTILFSKYVYNANWDGNPGIIAGTMLIFSALIVGMGMLLGLLIRNYSLALMSILLLMLFFASIAGSFTPSSALAFLNEVSPMYHAKILLFGTIYGYSSQVMIKAFLWLTGQTLAVFGLAAFLSGRVRYDNI